MNDVRTPTAQPQDTTVEVEEERVHDDADPTIGATSAATPEPAVAATPAGTEAAPAGTEIEVECPGCGLSLVGEAPRATASWFCPRCDYPLFWVSQPAAPTPTAQQKRARRRLPGTGGATVLGAEKCWHCGEMNEPGETTCLRCAATLPKPQPPAVPVPVIEVTRRERVVVRTVVWPYVSAAVLAGASVALAGAAWAFGG